MSSWDLNGVLLVTRLAMIPRALRGDVHRGCRRDASTLIGCEAGPRMLEHRAFGHARGPVGSYKDVQSRKTGKMGSKIGVVGKQQRNRNLNQH